MMYYSELSSKMINIFPLLMNNNARINILLIKYFIIYCLFNKYSYICAVILLIKKFVSKSF